MKKIAIILLAVCLFTTGCVFFPAEEELLQPPLIEGDSLVYDTATVEIRDVTKITDVTIAFDYADMQTVAFDNIGSGAFIKEFNVRVGDTVAKGDVIARLYDSQMAFSAEEARLEYESARDTYEAIANDPNIDWRTKRTYQRTMDAAKLKYDMELLYMENSVLLAPCNGVITWADPDIKPFSPVKSYQELARITVDDTVIAKYYGQRYSFFAEGDYFDAVVTQNGAEHTVRLKATYNAGKYDTSSTKSYSVTFAVESTGGASLDAGLSGTISIVTASLKNALTVPLACVKNYLSSRYVRLYSEGVITEMYITYMLSDGEFVAISPEDGLKEGDTIIVG